MRLFTFSLRYCQQQKRLAFEKRWMRVAKELDVSTVSVVEVSQEILDSARLTPSELKVEMAVHLYEQGRLSVGKARELADMTLWEFRQLLALRGISPHYDEADLDEDVATLRELGRL
jgi:predicted HTH domain antitoxin